MKVTMRSDYYSEFEKKINKFFGQLLNNPFAREIEQMLTSDENHNLIRHLPIKIYFNWNTNNTMLDSNNSTWDHGLATVFISSRFLFVSICFRMMMMMKRLKNKMIIVLAFVQSFNRSIVHHLTFLCLGRFLFFAHYCLMAMVKTIAFDDVS